MIDKDIYTIELIEKYEKLLLRNNNSYKYVLGLSILMIKPKSRIIKFEEIADKVVDIYFRNIFKYNLIEHNKNQPTKVQQDMKIYFDTYGYKNYLTNLDKENIIKLIVQNKNNGFFKYVLPCFIGAKKNDKGQYIYPAIGENEFFYYDLNKEVIVLSDEFLDIINQNQSKLKAITIKKYTEYLEKRNPNNKSISEILNYY